MILKIIHEISYREGFPIMQFFTKDNILIGVQKKSNSSQVKNITTAVRNHMDQKAI